MSDVLCGVPGCVTTCDRGGGSKLAKNSVTYFMDGPLSSNKNLYSPLQDPFSEALLTQAKRKRTVLE